MSVIRITDKPEDQLIPTSAFKYASWDFDTFNPVQSAIFEHVSNDTNITIAAATSAGKTVMGEMYMSDEIYRRGGKAIYVGPLKALAKEKSDDWTSAEHHFNKLNISICTGDYRFTKSRIDELNKSNCIVMTPEMLASRCRNQKSEKSTFLKEVGTVIFDESHLLTVPSRGDHIEVAMMKLAEINPNIRFVLLSATMPNVDELCEWVSTLTKRDTVLIESKYRPCPLVIHYQTYFDGESGYEEKEMQKVATALGLVDKYSEDKFLIFAHTKRTGKLMVESLAASGIDADFHNADLTAAKRHALEKRFKDDPKCRVIVATSTLAWGLNLPARRVIVLGINRGMSAVENYDIGQMIGRAGRPRFDPKGDAYILIPESRKTECLIKLRKPTEIRSQLLENVGGHYKTLAFHVVSEIHHGCITTKQGFHEWFHKSLAHHQQSYFNDAAIDNLIDLLVRAKAITLNEGQYEATAIGKIASMFYYSPFDVADLRSNFNNLFNKNMQGNEVAVALALGNIDSHRGGIVNKAERIDMVKFQSSVEKIYGVGRVPEAAIKAGCVYYNMMHGVYSENLSALQSALKFDLDRTLEVVGALDQMSGKWGRKEFFASLRDRLVYGVPEHLVSLCRIPEIGKVRAEALSKNGIKNMDDFCKASVSFLANTMKMKEPAAKKIHDAAKLMKIRSALT